MQVIFYNLGLRASNWGVISHKLQLTENRIMATLLAFFFITWKIQVLLLNRVGILFFFKYKKKEGKYKTKEDVAHCMLHVAGSWWLVARVVRVPLHL